MRPPANLGKRGPLMTLISNNGFAPHSAAPSVSIPRRSYAEVIITEEVIPVLRELPIAHFRFPILLPILVRFLSTHSLLQFYLQFFIVFRS